MRACRVALAGAWLTVLIVLPGFAAELTGVVRGVDRAALAGVAVTATSAVTGALRTAQSDEQGRYRIGGLPAGTYEISVQLAGFSAERRSIELGDSPKALDLTLRPAVNEEITVTARKREESLIEVPIAISTVSAIDMEERGTANFLESLESLPNVVAESPTSSDPRVTIRGISSFARPGFEPGIGYYLDEIYLPRSQAVDKLLIDIDRIEVLRGPQGSSFGKNTIGGVINLVTSKPSSETKGSIELAAGKYDLRQARAFLAGPLAGDKVSGKISLGLHKRDGWIENRTEGLDDLMSEDGAGGRAQVLLTPSARAMILVSADYAANDDIQTTEEVHSGLLFPLDGDGADRSLAPDVDQFDTRQVAGGSLRADVTMGRHLFTSITGFRTFEWHSFQDQDATSIDLVTLDWREELDYLSQELRLASTESGSFSWLGGLYYSAESLKSGTLFHFGEGLLFVFGIPPVSGFRERIETIADVDETSLAGFFSGTWALSERASLGFGARLSAEHKEMSYRQQVIPFLGLVLGFAAPVAPTTQSFSDTEPAGDLSLTYSFTPDVTGYLRLAHGFKSGGFSAGVAATSDPGSLTFSTETVDALEVGFRSFLCRNRVRLNAAAFYLEQHDKQEDVWTGTQFLVRNAAEARSRGAEVELAANPASGLEVLFNAGYNDATYARYVDRLLGVDYSGNTLVAAPEWTGSLGVQYYLPVSRSAVWFIRGDANYRSENPRSVDNNPLFGQEAHTVVTARTGIDLRGGRYTIALWVKNLSDESYSLGGWELFGTNYWNLNIPRTYALELRFRM